MGSRSKLGDLGHGATFCDVFFPSKRPQVRGGCFLLRQKRWFLRKRGVVCAASRREFWGMQASPTPSCWITRKCTSTRPPSGTGIVVNQLGWCRVWHRGCRHLVYSWSVWHMWKYDEPLSHARSLAEGRRFHHLLYYSIYRQLIILNYLLWLRCSARKISVSVKEKHIHGDIPGRGVLGEDRQVTPLAGPWCRIFPIRLKPSDRRALTST